MNNLDINTTEFCVIDFETTGTSSNGDRAIELGMVKVKNNKITDTYQSFFDPERPIPYFITNLTGITDNDVEKAPTFKDEIDNIISFIGDAILVAHNMRFDYSFLKSEFEFAREELIENKTLCTLILARKLYPELKSKSLGSLVEHFRIRHRDVHRALGDASATAKILLKMIPKCREEHSIESINDLLTFQSPTRDSNIKVIKKSLENDVKEVSSNPGVYIFKNREEEIVYIGKAKSLKTRLRNYFMLNAAGKAKKIVRKSSRLEKIETNSELTALVLEAELVKKFNPPMNSQLKKFSQNYFIRLNNEHDYPIPKVTSKFDFDGTDYFGPYSQGEVARSIVDIIQRTFLLRECTEKEFRKNKKCYLADIERCLAPCIDSVNDDYKSELQKAYDFLAGKNQHAVDRLLAKMKECSESKKYEEAAFIRDTVNLILNQLNKSSILAEPVNKANVLIKIRSGHSIDFVLMLEGKVYIKDYPVDDNYNFDTAVYDYFSGTIKNGDSLTEKDLERMKIALSWMVKNRTNIDLHYLKEYSSETKLWEIVSTQ